LRRYNEVEEQDIEELMPPSEVIEDWKSGRGLHSSTFQLNVSAFCGQGVRRGVVEGGVEEVLGGIRE